MEDNTHHKIAQNRPYIAYLKAYILYDNDIAINLRCVSIIVIKYAQNSQELEHISVNLNH